MNVRVELKIQIPQDKVLYANQQGELASGPLTQCLAFTPLAPSQLRVPVLPNAWIHRLWGVHKGSLLALRGWTLRRGRQRCWS